MTVQQAYTFTIKCTPGFFAKDDQEAGEYHRAWITAIQCLSIIGDSSFFTDPKAIKKARKKLGVAIDQIAAIPCGGTFDGGKVAKAIVVEEKGGSHD